MTQTRIFYYLYVRNADDTGDLLVLSSHPDDDNALLCEEPSGEGQTIDPIMGTLEVGSYTWIAADRYDGGDTYTITSILADADARNQLLSHKCIGKYSIDDGATKLPLHTGYLNDLKLSDAATYTFIVGDTDRRERDSTLFKTITDTFDKVSNIIGGPVEAAAGVAYQGTPTRAWGPIIDYGPARMEVIANPSGLVDSTNRITLSLVGANLPPRYLGFQGVWNGKVPNPAEYIDQQMYQYWEADADGLYATDGSQQSQPWGSFPSVEVKLKAVSGGAVTKSFPIAQATRKASTYVWFPGGPDFPVGDEKALVANSNDWLIVAWDVATMGTAPSVGTAFDVWVRPKVISEKNPLHLAGHPVDLLRLANTELGISDDSVSAAATKTAIGPLWYELRIVTDGGIEYSKFAEFLKGSAGFATRYTADNVQQFIPTRATQPASVATVVISNAIGDDQTGEPKDVIFRVSESTAIKGVDYKLTQFRLWNANTDASSDRPVDGVVAEDLTITGTRRDDEVKGDKIITYDVPGMIMLAGGSFVLNQPLALRAWIEDGGNVIIDRAGWGWIEYEYEVLDTVAGEVGDYHDLELPHVVNSKTAQSPVTQRGGTRRVQIVSVTRAPGTKKIKARDAGNLAQDAPEAPDAGGSGTTELPVPELSLAASVDAPTTIATVTEGNVSELQDLNADTELQYLVQTATPASTDEGLTFGPLLSSTGADTIDAPAILSGQTIWVRGRATIAATGQVGAWSDWISITLGPDDDGTEGALPPFTLALAVDGAGSLSATASSVDAAITKVYFLAGAAGGAPPLFDDVVAAASDELAPFAMTGLATMAEGEVRTVGAVGEDALGNRTLLVLASITRGTNTGTTSGTPANTPMTMIAGPPVVVRNVGSSLREPKGFKVTRKFWNTENILTARIQHNCWQGASSGTEIHWAYFDLDTDPGALVPLETGVLVRADREAFPEVGNQLALSTAAQGTNVLMTFATKGGDGSSTLKTSDLFIEPNGALAPPPSPSGGAPGLPNGGVFGLLILDLNAVTLAGALSEGDTVGTWPDDTGITGDASPYTTGSTQSSPIFHATGYGGGSAPMVSVTSNQGVATPLPDPTGSTFYVALDITSGQGTNGGGAGPNAIIISTEGTNNVNGWISVRADGKLQAGVNAGSFGWPSNVGSTDRRGTPIIVALSWNNGLATWELYVDGVLETNVTSNALLTNSWAGLARMYYGNANTTANGSETSDIHRILCYDSPHSATSVGLVTTALQTIIAAGGASGGGSGGSSGGGTGTPAPPTSTTPPDYLMTFTDPNTGATITRITGTPGDAVPTVGGVWPNVAYHNYPKDQPFNADETLICLKQVSNEWGPGSYLFLDGTTYAPLFTSTGGTSGGGEKRWHPTNADVMIGLNSSGRVVWWNPTTDVTTTKVAAVSGYTNNEMGPNEGNPSYDGSKLVAKAIRTSDGHLVARVLNVDAGTAGVVIDLTAAGITDLDWVSISAGGNYVVAFATIDGVSQRVKVWNASTGSQVAYFSDANRIGHGDLGINTDGDEVIVSATASGATYLHHAIMRKLSDGTITDLSGGAKISFNWHTGSRSQNDTDWSIFTQNDNSGYEWDGLIVRVKMTGTPTVEKVCSHNCINIDYDSAPKAVASPSGTRILFASNWGNTSGRPMQTYIVEGWT